MSKNKILMGVNPEYYRDRKKAYPIKKDKKFNDWGPPSSFQECLEIAAKSGEEVNLVATSISEKEISDDTSKNPLKMFFDLEKQGLVKLKTKKDKDLIVIQELSLTVDGHIKFSELRKNKGSWGAIISVIIWLFLLFFGYILIELYGLSFSNFIRSFLII